MTAKQSCWLHTSSGPLRPLLSQRALASSERLMGGEENGSRGGGQKKQLAWSIARLDPSEWFLGYNRCSFFCLTYKRTALACP